MPETPSQPSTTPTPQLLPAFTSEERSQRSAEDEPNINNAASAFAEALASLRSRHGLSRRDLGARVFCSYRYVWDLESGRRHASADLAASLDKALNANGTLVTLAAAARSGRLDDAHAGDDETDAYELVSRVEASDVSTTSLSAIETAFDRLAIAYQGTPPADLIPKVRRHLTYVAQLIDQRATMAQRRRLLVVGGWLSLLAATLHVDLHQRAAADARLATALALAEHAGHAAISAWCLETRAWDALTEGQYQLAVDLSQAGQRVAPRGSSAMIQATAQEGRAWARLGDRKATINALERVASLVSPLAQPDEPEHHYQYDPAKRLAYTATTLAWVGDPAAEGFAREVVARLESGQDGGLRPRRAASARIDLALALSLHRPDEAAAEALAAIGSGRIVPSNAWRVAEVVDRVESAGLPEAMDLRDAYRALVSHP